MFFLWLWSCSDPECTSLCRDAKKQQEQCLLEWGVSWDAAGYTDSADYLAWCETWAWEQRQLGEKEACEDQAIKVENSDCNSFPQIQW